MFLVKYFIKDYQQIEKSEVRERYGLYVSVVSILCNITLSTSKLAVGLLANSISIQADAFNNFSDVGSNIATLLGFKLASKHPDVDHPYGHGRFEYIAGLMISFLIFLVAFQSLKEAIVKIIHPVTIVFNPIVIFVLIFSILVKFYMGYLNSKIGRLIDSSALKAASKDSFNDTMTTLASLASMMIFYWFNLNLDGWFGFVVSLAVLKSAYGVFKDTTDPLLGKAPDRQLVKDIEKLVLSFPSARGIHDLILHDYGPGRSFVTLHVEVDANADFLQTHDEVDLIERAILEKFKLHATLHMDPIDTSDEHVREIRNIVEKVVKKINQDYSIHDFRIVRGPSHTNILFDILVPADDKCDEKELKEKVASYINAINNKYFAIIQIDRAYY